MIVTGVSTYVIEAHAIVSADDRIADASGMTPASLRFEADWARFQAALDRAAVIVLGRLGHAANPNRNRRNRLVLSSGARGVERRADAWWWNPSEATLAEALAIAAPGGGMVAVPGGQRVFAFFLAVGYDAFHLTRAAQVHIPDGIPLFSAVRADHGADAILAAAGLQPDSPLAIDPAAGVTLTTWRGPDLKPSA